MSWDDDLDENDWDEAEVDRAPICPVCGVTALAADEAGETRFVCENPDCESFGAEV